MTLSVTRPIPQIVRYLFQMWKGLRLQFFLNLFIGVAGVGIRLLFVWVTKLAIDTATGVTHEWSLTWLFVLLGVITAVQIALSRAARWIAATLGLDGRCKMQRACFQKLLTADWLALKQFHSGHLINRIERDVRDVAGFLTEGLPNLFNTVVQFAGAFFLLFYMDKMLACIVVFVVPFFLLAGRLYVRKMRRLTHEVRNTESRIQAFIQETLQHILVIKTLERTDTAGKELLGRQATLRGEVVESTRYSVITTTVMNIGFSTGYLLTFIWGTTSLRDGLITYGAMLAFIQLVGQIQTPVRTLTQFIPIFISTFTAAERLMDIDDIKQEAHTQPRKLKGGVGIALKDLTFRYTPTSRLIFDNFSYEFPAGSITAILGETGAGKTTLIRLLLALVTPTSGRAALCADGKTEDISPALRANFTYVPQGNTLLSGTIRSNLQLGNPDATEAEMRRALSLACADFVEKLPDGLDAPCGEMGDGLSEGQSQRIAIARALLKESPILLLDEATSSLDADTERRVLQNIASEYGGRTTIIFITHRPEALRHATQTLRLAKTGK